jgi:hypothetical protein
VGFFFVLTDGRQITCVPEISLVSWYEQHDTNPLKETKMATYKVKVSVRTGESPPYKEVIISTEVQANSDRHAKDLAESEALNDPRLKEEQGSITAEAVECVKV